MPDLAVIQPREAREVFVGTLVFRCISPEGCELRFRDDRATKVLHDVPLKLALSLDMLGVYELAYESEQGMWKVRRETSDFSLSGVYGWWADYREVDHG
jgi:hypothetical protein